MVKPWFKLGKEILTFSKNIKEKKVQSFLMIVIGKERTVRALLHSSAPLSIDVGT